MPERVVITRSRRTQAQLSKEFTFTRGMVPGIETHDGLPTALKNYRLAAWEQYEALPMPTTKDEPWRRTDLHGMPAGAFHLPGDQTAGLESPPAELLKPLVGDEHGGQLVLTPAGSQLYMDPALAEKGVIFTDYMTAERQYGDLLSRFVGQIVRSNEGKFAAMAAARARTGAFVYIPRGVVVEQPLHSILWGPGANLAYFSHIMVWLDDGAALTFVHENASHSQGDEQSLHCGIVEVHVGEGANLRFVELQSWGSQVWNFSHERARVNYEAHGFPAGRSAPPARSRSSANASSAAPSACHAANAARTVTPARGATGPSRATGVLLRSMTNDSPRYRMRPRMSPRRRARSVAEM